MDEMEISRTLAYKKAFNAYLRRGTPQIHYEGSNGVTVVVETVGRNAGKIISIWRHQ